jgi:mono/diheme cytochrome c family protein
VISRRVGLAVALWLRLVTAAAQPASADEAAVLRNYTLNCMGCHGASGAGVPGKIPPLADSLGWFVHSPAGREFIIRVPGASNSALTDEELAQVTNLMLKRFSAGQLPADFRPYTADEIAAGRRPAYADVQAVRTRVITDLRKQGVPLAYGY